MRPIFLFSIAFGAAAAIGISEAVLFTAGKGWWHFVDSFLAFVLTAFTALALLFEIRNIREMFSFESVFWNSIIAVFLGWMTYFLVFLFLTLIAVPIGSIVSILKTGYTPSLSAISTFLIKSGGVIVFCSLLPPVIMAIAVRLGFKPDGNT